VRFFDGRFVQFVNSMLVTAFSSLLLHSYAYYTNCWVRTKGDDRKVRLGGDRLILKYEVRHDYEKQGIGYVACATASKYGNPNTNSLLSAFSEAEVVGAGKRPHSVSTLYSPPPSTDPSPSALPPQPPIYPPPILLNHLHPRPTLYRNLPPLLFPLFHR